MTDPLSFSTYEAKARFSEVVRLVREGKTVTITYHGEPVAEMRPFDEGEDLGQRLERMQRNGTLVISPEPFERPAPLADRPGALQRFIDERHL